MEFSLQSVAQALAGTMDPKSRAQSEAYLEQVWDINTHVVDFHFQYLLFN